MANSLVFSAEFAEDKTRKMPKIKQVAEMTQVWIPSRLIKRNPSARLQVVSWWWLFCHFCPIDVIFWCLCFIINFTQLFTWLPYRHWVILPFYHAKCLYINRCSYKANYNSIITIRKRYPVDIPEDNFFGINFEMLKTQVVYAFLDYMLLVIDGLEWKIFHKHVDA